MSEDDASPETDHVAHDVVFAVVVRVVTHHLAARLVVPVSLIRNMVGRRFGETEAPPMHLLARCRTDYFRFNVWFHTDDRP